MQSLTFRQAIEQITKIVGPEITFRLSAEHWHFNTGSTEFQFHIGLHKPEVVCESFNSLEEAVAWVQSQISPIEPDIDGAKIEEAVDNQN